MSIRAGTILHLQGNNVIDRIQNAGLGNVNLPVETIREVGNRQVVDRVVQEPDFTFTLNSLDVSCDIMAWLTGRPTTGSGSATAPGSTDPVGQSYDWLDCGFVNIPSPWKDPTTGSAGVILAGHLIPGYYPTQIDYSFGVTADASQQVQLQGGSYFYGEFAPREEIFVGNGATKAFVSTDPAIQYRKGGKAGSVFKVAFGILVNGQLQTEVVDYTVSGGGANPGSAVTVNFIVAPPNGADVRFCYFTSAAKSFPQTVHASNIVKPGAVRGRNIQVYLNDGSGDVKLPGVQTATLSATVQGEIQRELGTDDMVGWVVNGTECTGTLTVRPNDEGDFFAILARVTGVSRNELFGWFNDNEVVLKIRIENPKAPGQIIKTLVVDQAKFQPPGTPSQVNQSTDFAIDYSSDNGTFREVKGLY